MPWRFCSALPPPGDGVHLAVSLHFFDRGQLSIVQQQVSSHFCSYFFQTESPINLRINAMPGGNTDFA